MTLKERLRTYMEKLYEKYGYKFNSKYHQHSIKDLKLTSVTGFINGFEEPFDADEIIDKITKLPSSDYYELEPEFIKSQWACLRMLGTNMHTRVELWFKEKINDVDFEYADYFRKCNLSPDNCLSEVPVFNKSYKLGGIIDIVQIIETDEEVKLFISDVKTSSGMSVNEDKQRVASLQVYLYSLLLQVLLKGFKYHKPISVHRGQIISIESSIKDMSKPIDIFDLTQFKPPLSLNTLNRPQIYDEIKEKMLQRKEK